MSRHAQGHAGVRRGVPIIAGTLLTRRRERPAWARIERGIIQETGHDEPPARPDMQGWIVPSPVNGHTHIGDSWLHGRPGKPTTVKELFGPGGWKHQHLAQADPEAQREGAQDLGQSMAAAGTAAFIDFREGGLPGIAWLRDLDLPLRPIIYGRTKGAFDEDEARRVAHTADGIGLSGLRDMSSKHLDAWADIAKEAGKPLAIHVSEDQRDDVDAALSLEPQFVVHMTCGKPSDFDALQGARVPIVACPRSNQHFGRMPPVDAMLEAECRVAFGTDNGMLQDGDLWAEVRAVRARFPEIPVASLLRAATYHARDLADLPEPAWERRAPADWIVIPDQTLQATRSKPGFVVP